MIRQMAKSGTRRALLGMAGMVFSLLLVDGALVSASRNDGTPALGVVQGLQVGAQMVMDGGARFVNDLRAVYQLTHLDEIVPEAAESAAPASEQRTNIFYCSEARPMKAPAKAII